MPPGEATELLSPAPGLFDRPGDLPPLPCRRTTLYHAGQPGSEGRFCHHPNLVVFREQLFCMFSNGLEGEDLPGQRVLYCRSPDGVNWSAAEVLASSGPEGTCIAAGWHSYMDDSGEATLVAYFTVVAGGDNFHPETALHAVTSRTGLEWTSPAERIVAGFFIEGPRLLHLPSENTHDAWRGRTETRLLLCGEQVGAARKRGRMKVLITERRSGLEGWAEASPPLEDTHLSVFGYCEGAPIVSAEASGANGDTVAQHLALAFRSNTGRLFVSEAQQPDLQGGGWSSPRQSGFPDSESRFHSGVLPDGSAILINNPMPRSGPDDYDRSVLTVARSTDGGRRFAEAWVLRGEPTTPRFDGLYKLAGYQYPHAVCWREQLFVAFSVNKEDVELCACALEALTGGPKM